MGKTWTETRVTMLRSLWADGVPGGVIAKQLGLTRGMVAGKRHSLGLPPRVGEVRKAAERRNGSRTAVICETPGSRASTATRQVLAERVAVLDALAAPLAGSNPKPWELRRAGECAFPVAAWGSPMLSCCEPVLEPAAGGRRGYCFGHCEILAGRPWPPVNPLDQPGPDPRAVRFGLPPQDPAPELAAEMYEPVRVNALPSGLPERFKGQSRAC